MLIALLKITGGLVLLVHGADQFVTGASQTARKLGVPPLTAVMGVVVFVYDYGRFRRSKGALLLAGFIAYQTWLFLAATS